MQEILSVKNLIKSYNGNKVLKDVSLSVREGEVVAVIGKSGGGKTTMLRCVNLLTLPDSGEITIDGLPLFNSNPECAPTADQRAEAREKIGLVFQNFNLFPQYNVLNNLMLAPKCHGKKTRDEILAKANELLDRMGLSEKTKSYPSELSGGQQQRVAIARALMLEPALLCFDEPTSALDPELTGEVVNIIKDLKMQGKTMVIVTHDMDFARLAADRIIFFADGVIEEEGTPEELFRNPKSEKLRSFIQLGNDKDYVHHEHPLDLPD